MELGEERTLGDLSSVLGSPLSNFVQSQASLPSPFSLSTIPFQNFQLSQTSPHHLLLLNSTLIKDGLRVSSPPFSPSLPLRPIPRAHLSLYPPFPQMLNHSRSSVPGSHLSPSLLLLLLLLLTLIRLAVRSRNLHLWRKAGLSFSFDLGMCLHSCHQRQLPSSSSTSTSSHHPSLTRSGSLSQPAGCSCASGSSCS